MSPLPARFTARWKAASSRQPYDDAVCWHLLLGGDPGVRATAAEARRRLGRFSGLHWTPPEWLHVTVLRAGTAGQVTAAELEKMIAAAQDALAGVPPVTVKLERLLYHPEAIALGVQPGPALHPVLAAAGDATRGVLGESAADNGDAWAPHLTLCYSTADQPAAPLIASLGKALPAREVTIGELSLVVQHGPERSWDWRVAGTARLHGAPSS
jgi:2'-5' RNA ligase